MAEESKEGETDPAERLRHLREGAANVDQELGRPLEEISDCELYSYSKQELFYLTCRYNISSYNCPQAKLRQKVKACRDEILELMAQLPPETPNPNPNPNTDPPDPRTPSPPVPEPNNNNNISTDGEDDQMAAAPTNNPGITNAADDK